MTTTGCRRRALLHRDFDKGIELLFEASVEVKLAIVSVNHMKEGMR